MLFEPLEIEGVLKIGIEPRVDDRGFFARTFCRDEFQSNGIIFEVLQESISFNRHKGTVRGMHFQRTPQEETKIVRCTKGKIFDVVVDLRPRSKSFKVWLGVELSEENRRALYIPKGIAHGFQTLCDDAEVFYSIDTPHNPGLSSGVRWNDPSIDIRWPLPVSKISPRDLDFPDMET